MASYWIKIISPVTIFYLFFFHFRDADSFDMRRKLPFCVGLLLRLLKKNHRVYVTCTTGFDRSPACVIAYLHWMTDTSLHAAYNFVTGLHSCRPDRYLLPNSQISYECFGLMNPIFKHSVFLFWVGRCSTSKDVKQNKWWISVNL